MKPIQVLTEESKDVIYEAIGFLITFAELYPKTSAQSIATKLSNLLNELDYDRPETTPLRDR